MLLFAIGIALLVSGLRGRLVDSSGWTCQRCWFHLAGVYPSIKVCPECGAELKAPNAVRAGAWRREPWRLWTAGVCLVVPAAALVLFSATLSGSWLTLAPDWFLRLQGRYGGSGAESALNELADRIADGRIASGAGFAAAAMDRQADLSSQWAPGWGNIFIAAESKGFVTPAQQIAFRKRAVHPELSVPARVRCGDLVPLGLDFTMPGSGFFMARYGTRDDACFYPVLVSASIEGVPLALEPVASPPFSLRNGVALKADERAMTSLSNLFSPVEQEVQARVPAGLKSGRGTLAATWRVYILPSSSSSNALASWDVQLSAPVEVRSGDSPIVDLKLGSELRQQMKNAIRVTIHPTQIIMSPPPPGDPRLQLPEVELAWDGLPGPVCWQVVVRCGTREWPLQCGGGTSAYKAGTEDYRFRDWQTMSRDDVDFVCAQEKLDVVLRPDPDGARRLGIWMICGEEVEFRDVAVKKR